MKFSGKHINAEENAYAAFFQQYNDQVFSIIERKINKNEDIKDTLQEVFIHLWEYRQSLDTENIIFNTCNQKIAEFYRKKGKQPLSDSIISDRPDTYPQERKSRKEKEQRLTELETVIELIIPPLRKKIFKLNKLEGIPQWQIAQQFNMSKSAVENQISKAMNFLKKHLKKS